MDKRDYENYFELYSMMVEYLTPPDLVVYVRRGVDCLKQRIKMRGREYEKNIPDDYLHLLNSCYDEWIGSYKHGKLLVIDVNKLDFVANIEDFSTIVGRVDLELNSLFG